MAETDFVSSGNRFLFFDLFFYKRKPSLKLMAHFWGGKTLYLLVEKGFFPTETVFFYSVFLSCKWKPSVKLVETK